MSRRDEFAIGMLGQERIQKPKPQPRRPQEEFTTLRPTIRPKPPRI